METGTCDGCDAAEMGYEVCRKTNEKSSRGKGDLHLNNKAGGHEVSEAAAMWLPSFHYFLTNINSLSSGRRAAEERTAEEMTAEEMTAEERQQRDGNRDVQAKGARQDLGASREVQAEPREVQASPAPQLCSTPGFQYCTPCVCLWG
jgi:hypothetical protein